MADVLKKVPVREQDPKVRATNFNEVCYGYNKEEAMEEANRCIHCKNAKCITGCPVNINIPDFIEKVKEGSFLLFRRALLSPRRKQRALAAFLPVRIRKRSLRAPKDQYLSLLLFRRALPQPLLPI